MDLDTRVRPRARPSVWLTLIQLVVGIILVVGAGAGLGALTETLRKRRLPDGWQIIRPPHEVSAIAINGETVWAGGNDGLYAIDRQDGALLPLPSGAPKLRHVRDLTVDRRGRLWIAHHRGVTIHAEGGWTHLSEIDGLLPGPATALLEDDLGNMWVGGENGVVCYDTRETFTRDNGLGQRHTYFQQP